nr:hypothetical protein CFP56_09828 [Quercus suber]
MSAMTGASKGHATGWWADRRDFYDDIALSEVKFRRIITSDCTRAPYTQDLFDLRCTSVSSVDIPSDSGPRHANEPGMCRMTTAPRQIQSIDFNMARPVHNGGTGTAGSTIFGFARPDEPRIKNSPKSNPQLSTGRMGQIWPTGGFSGLICPKRRRMKDRTVSLSTFGCRKGLCAGDPSRFYSGLAFSVRRDSGDEVATLFVGAIATPPIVAERSILGRDAGTTAYNDVAGLYAEIKHYTGAINATAKKITSHSTAAQNLTAQSVYIANIKAITTAITSTDSKVLSLVKSSRSIESRQTSAELAALSMLVDDLILEINGALQLVVDTLGLTRKCSSSSHVLKITATSR